MSPRVITDTGRIAKVQTGRVEGLGDISVLTRVSLRRGEAERLLAIGWKGYATLEADSLQPVHVVKFASADSVGRMVVRDVDGDGAVEFVRLGEHWIGKTAVFAQDGAMRWQDSAEVTKRGPNATAVVDFDGDGRCEFATSFNVEESMRVVDCDGNWLRELPCRAQTHTLIAVDLEDDGKEELAALDGQALHVWGADGRERLCLHADDCGYLSRLEVLRDPTPGAMRNVFLLEGSQGLSLWSLDGQRLELGDPQAARQRLANWDGTRVRARLGSAEWDVRAGLYRQQAWPAGFVAARLHLRFFGEKLEYEELVRAPGEGELLHSVALLALGEEQGRPACVLASCGSDVIRYVAR